MASRETPDERSEGLRSTAEGFCKAFVAGTSPSEILDTFFTSIPKITEHGPEWAKTRLPFLNTTFRGRRSQGPSSRVDGHTCDDYYDLLNATLSFHPNPNTVPSKDEFLVANYKVKDGEWQGGVTIKLNASFSSKKTGKSWKEDFVYVLSEFDDDMKIGSLELWADPLSAWLAVED